MVHPIIFFILQIIMSAGMILFVFNLPRIIIWAVEDVKEALRN